MVEDRRRAWVVTRKPPYSRLAGQMSSLPWAAPLSDLPPLSINYGYGQVDKCQVESEGGGNDGDTGEQQQQQRRPKRQRKTDQREGADLASGGVAAAGGETFKPASDAEALLLTRLKLAVSDWLAERLLRLRGAVHGGPYHLYTPCMTEIYLHL